MIAVAVSQLQYGNAMKYSYTYELMATIEVNDAEYLMVEIASMFRWTGLMAQPCFLPCESM